MTDVLKIAHVLLVLSDGRVVLQRRDSKAPLLPNKLAFFGGHIEDHELPDQAMRRELREETSLDVASLEIQYIHELELISQNGVISHFYTYRAYIPNADFEVYEGSGSEVYSIDQALARDDIVSSVRYALMKLGG